MSADEAVAADARVRSTEPLWRRTAREIEEGVDAGMLVPGARLPPERELCEQLGVSRVTLRKALADLGARGVLTPSRGRGWFVAAPEPATGKEWPNELESFTATAARMGLHPSAEVIHADTVSASLDTAEALGVAPGTPLLHLRRVRLLDGMPIAVDSSFVPVARIPDHDRVDFATASLFAELERHGSTPERGEATVEARRADDDVAQYLGIASGAPVLVLRQLAFDPAGHPVASSVVTYAGERYRLRTVFVRSSG